MPYITPKDFFSKGKVKVVGSETDNFDEPVSSVSSAELAKKNIFRQFIDDTKESINTRRGTLEEAQGQLARKERTAGEYRFRELGQAAGLVGDLGFNALKLGARGISELTPDSIEQPIIDTAKSVGSATMNAASSTQLIRTGLILLDQGMDVYKNWAHSNPRKAEAFENVVNIAGIIPAGKGASLAAEGVEQGTKSVARNALRVVDDVAQTGKNAFEELPNFLNRTSQNILDSRLVNSAKDVITPIEKGVIKQLETNVDAQKTLNKYADQAEKALADYSVQTPMELAGKEGENALGILSTKSQELGKSKKAVTQNLKDIDTGAIVTDTLTAIKEEVEDILGVKFNNKGEFVNVEGRTSKISNSQDFDLLKDVNKKLLEVSKSPNFQKVDDAVDYIQDRINRLIHLGLSLSLIVLIPVLYWLYRIRPECHSTGYLPTGLI